MHRPSGDLPATNRGRLIQSLRREGNAFFTGRFAFLVFPQPVFPLLSGSAILARKFDSRDVRVAYATFFCSLWREVFGVGIRESRLGFAIKDKRLDPLTVLEREGHISAII